MNHYTDVDKLIRLGNGARRTVYALDDKRVLKIPIKSGDNINYRNAINECICEGKIWDLLKGSPISEMLCPVLEYDPEGFWLVMSRAILLTDKTLIPKNVPDWVCDYKKTANWGYVNGQLKLIDYGRVDSYRKLCEFLGVEIDNSL